jgi:DNA-directed RNA polymerase specialized sigma24 family protein
MPERDEERLKLLISRYQQRIFALVLYLIGGDQDKTYDICASSFAEAMRASPPLEHEEAFLTTLIGIAIEKSRATRTIPTPNELDLLELPDAEKGPLRIVLKGLQTLDFELKVPLLLRFQLNLSYSDIGTVIRTSGSNARIKTAQARAQLDKEIERILSNA